VVDATEWLQEHEAIEQPAHGFRPIFCPENDIAIDANQLSAIVGQPPQRDIQQPFLMPHDILSAQLHEDLCIILAELEIRPVRHLHGDEWDAQSLAKHAVVREPAPPAHRVEIAGDGPELARAPFNSRRRRAHLQPQHR
jgi:hypothetical protein